MKNNKIIKLILSFLLIASCTSTTLFAVGDDIVDTSVTEVEVVTETDKEQVTDESDTDQDNKELKY